MDRKDVYDIAVARCSMTQDERWMQRYNEVVEFIKVNHGNPSKYVPEEKLMVHYLKRGRKLMNAGNWQNPDYQCSRIY